MNKESVILVLCSLGIAQGLFLCIYLLTLKKGNRLAHRLLVLVILGLIIRIGKSILNEYLHLIPWQRNLGIAGILLVGPSVWLYGRVLLKKQSELTTINLLHFLPYILFTIFCWAVPNRADFVSYAIYYLVFAHLFVYLLLSISQLIHHKEERQTQLFKWHRNLILGIALVWFFYIGNISGLIPFYIGGALFFSFLVYIFSFLLLRQHTFSLEKYQRSTLNPSTAKNLMQSLTQFFESEEADLHSELTLASVAKNLDTSPRILSQVINENKGINFSEFVNYYRIEKAKKLLMASETKNEKMASIAFDSGFGNVTSFNLAFKSFTNLTPSEFKKQAAKV